MRIIQGSILATALFLSSYAGTVTLPSQSWMSFTPSALYFDSSITVYRDLSAFAWPSCSSITDSTDFYWAYYDACTCTTPCCPSLFVASKRPFYVSRMAMNYSDYKGNPAKLSDATLFVKCTTSVSLCSFATLASSDPGLCLVPGGVDSLSTRLFVFQTKGNIFVPLRINRIVLGTINWYVTGQQFVKYDSMCVTFGSSLLTGTAVPTRAAPGSRSAPHISKSGAGFVISGFGEDKSRLDIVNGQGRTVYRQPVSSSSCVIGKNILGPGIYFMQVHSRTGISSIMLPVQ